MPLLKNCAYPGCRETIPDGQRYCAFHEKKAKEFSHRMSDKNRPTSRERGYGYAWEKARIGFLKRNPLCVSCQKKGIVQVAEVVDHIIPHKGNQSLFWDDKNWQPLCKKCHDIKTATEDGGFGRNRK